MISWFWNWYHIWNWYAGSRLYFYLEILWLRIGERDAFCFTTPYFPWGHGNSCLQVVYFSHTHTHPCSVMSDSETSWTVTCQAPLCMGFPRQEYWSGLPFPPPGDRHDPGSNLCLLCILHCRRILYCWATGETCINCKLSTHPYLVTSSLNRWCTAS